MLSRVVKTTTRQLIANVREFATHRPRDRVKVEEDEMSSRERRDAVRGMSSLVPNVSMLPFVNRKFISVEERWLQTYLTDALGSGNHGYVAKFLDDGHIDRLQEPIRRLSF